MVEIRVLGGVGVKLQAASELFDNHSVDALVFATCTVAHGEVDRLGNGTNRVLHAQGAGHLLRTCRRCNITAGSGLQRPYRAVLGLLNEPAIEREHGVASRGGAKMQRVGEVHAGFRAIESFGEQAGILDCDAR